MAPRAAAVTARTATVAKRTATASGPRWDPFMVATGGLSVLSLAWFALNLHAPWGPAAVGWLPGPVAMALSAIAVLRLAISPGLSPRRDGSGNTSGLAWR